MLVVPELAHEMECLERSEEAGFPRRLRRLRQRRDQLADALQLAAWRQGKLKLKSGGGGDDGDEEEEVIEEVVEGLTLLSSDAPASMCASSTLMRTFLPMEVNPFHLLFPAQMGGRKGEEERQWDCLHV